MKFDKVIYIRYIPLTAKVYEDFYLQQVMAAGIVVEYWDISKLFFADVSQLEDSSDLCTTLHFTSYYQLEEKISSLDRVRTLFISIMTLDGGQKKLYYLFTKYNCTLGIIGRNMFPQYSFKSKSLFKRLLYMSPSKLMTFIDNKLLGWKMQRGRIKGYDVVFLGGRYGWQGIGNISKERLVKAENIKINSDDYDIYLKLREYKNRLVDGEYILFLDEYLPLHPDVELLKMNIVTPEEYYPQLNAYFDRIEKQFGMPVIIAAHPKALRYKKENFFNGRSVYFGKSAMLSKDAYLVLAHDSTSINYPVAFGKRLHFITSDNLAEKCKSIHLNILNFAEYLGCNVQYFNHPDESINVVEKINTERYTAYKYDFQTSPETENILSVSIFINYLKE